ncbi:MAG: hypothetical protein LIP00_09720 [Parabacteroides sp.]|nr:hypothetical protein [Parabacteroides sp.]
MDETNKKLLLVVVLYNQRLHDTATYASLIAQSGEDVFIYDNSPRPQHAAGTGLPAGCKYVSDTANGGISKAYNAAGRYALEKGYEWMLFLDQDTVFASGILNEYRAVISTRKDIRLIVPPMKMSENLYMSPVKVRFHIARPCRQVPEGKASLWRYAPINSGLAVEVEAFHRVGGYNEKVKLDFSDYQFVRRFRKWYPDFYVLRSVCSQSFSNEIESAHRKLHRFDLFCLSLKHCERDNLFDGLCYFLVVVKRMASLMWQTRSFKPVKSVFSNFL